MDTSSAIVAVREGLAQRRTGCLEVQVPGRTGCAVYTVEGEILAAHSPLDGAAIIDRLVARARIDEGQAARLRETCARGADPTELLAGRIGEQEVARLMLGRFRQNLLDHLFAPGRFTFEPMDTVRVQYMQVGHDTASMLVQMERIFRRVSAWVPGRLPWGLSAADAWPAKEADRRVHALCGAGATVAEVLERSPFFEAETLHRIERLVSEGMIKVQETAPAPKGPDAKQVAHAVAAREAEEARRGEAARRTAHHAQGVQTVPDSPGRTPAAEMVAFVDHEAGERGLGKGRFSAKDEDRDQVDLDPPMPAPGAAPEQRAGPGLRFGGPRLGPEEIARKVEVCNQVLSEVMSAWADSPGHAQCRLMLGLLIEGPPLDHVSMFRGVKIDQAGCMVAETLVANVERRPAGERRRLINQGLLNLVDRALSSSAEQLDEAALDGLLQATAGFRQRLGL